MTVDSAKTAIRMMSNQFIYISLYRWRRFASISSGYRYDSSIQPEVAIM